MIFFLLMIYLLKQYEWILSECCYGRRVIFESEVVDFMIEIKL